MNTSKWMALSSTGLKFKVIHSSFFNRNVGVLEKRWPDLARVIRNQRCDKEVTVIDTRDRNRTVLVPDAKGKPHLLHSAYSPGDEAAEWVAVHPAWQREVVIYGFGLGYHIQAALNTGLRSLLVVECDPGLFSHALKLRDFSEALGDPRLDLIVERKIDDAALLLRKKIQSPYTVLWIHSPSVEIRPARYNRLTHEISSILYELRCSAVSSPGGQAQGFSPDQFRTILRVLQN